jgi:response regulator RpfG family c-di-GMP phosphodiesterase
MNKRRIAIIDDNSRQREKVKNLLAATEAEFFEIKAGHSCAAALARIRPDLVIVSITPALIENDHGLCRLLRDDPSFSGLTLILIGSGEEAEDFAQGLATNAFSYIDSLEVADKLVATVRQAFGKQNLLLRSRRILVVDDSHSVRLLMQNELSKFGYQVLLAENGRKALELLRLERPDVILSDIYMPEMNGIQLCETLHGDPDLASIPFVVMSTENDAGNMQKMMQFGAAAFIIKPFNLEQLILTLNKIFSYEFLLLLKENERLSGEQKLLLAGITSLIKALEARDHYTRGHSERVSRILAGLVRYSGGSQRQVERATIAGCLHDIGKIGIRDNVLLKPGRLTAEEFDMIKEHPAIGVSIVQNIPSIADILPVVASHHERVDGKGYPDGLKGDSIPLWARLTAVADTYDALTSDRPYRQGMGHSQAMAILGEVAGTQLCPECFRLFLEWSTRETHLFGQGQAGLISRVLKQDASQAA